MYHTPNNSPVFFYDYKSNFEPDVIPEDNIETINDLLNPVKQKSKKKKLLPGQKLLLQIHKLKQKEEDKKKYDKTILNNSIDNILNLF